jgi:CAAX prenyl protease-like protein
VTRSCAKWVSEHRIDAAECGCSTRSSVVVRVAPFIAFVTIGAITQVQTEVLPVAGVLTQWLHPLKGALAGLLLIWFWPHYQELRGKFEPRVRWWPVSVLSGIGVFALWISLDAPWMTIGSSANFNPIQTHDGKLNALLLASRLIGLIVVVPIMEELFWRSFLMRWLTTQEFLSVDPRCVTPLAFWTTAGLFAVEHHLWLAGLVAGIVFSALYVRSGSLWVPILAHAVANACLGAYIISYERWDLW